MSNPTYVEFLSNKRLELISEKASHSLMTGQEFDPFTTEHIDEAIRNMKDAGIDNIKAWCDLVRKPTEELREPYSMEALGRAVWCEIYEYWERIAKDDADATVSSLEELNEDYKGG